jgi:acetyl esterase/lipase
MKSSPTHDPTRHGTEKPRAAVSPLSGYLRILIIVSRLLFVPWFGLELKAVDQFEKETVVYKEVGTLAIKADIYHYSDTKVRPVVVSLHGGALIMGHRENLSGPVRNFALTNGYVLVSFSFIRLPRLSTAWRGATQSRSTKLNGRHSSS